MVNMLLQITYIHAYDKHYNNNVKYYYKIISKILLFNADLLTILKVGNVVFCHQES